MALRARLRRGGARKYGERCSLSSPAESGAEPLPLKGLRVFYGSQITIASGINIYSFFSISRMTIPDTQISISHIQNKYFGYPK